MMHMIVTIAEVFGLAAAGLLAALAVIVGFAVRLGPSAEHFDLVYTPTAEGGREESVTRSA